MDASTLLLGIYAYLPTDAVYSAHNGHWSAAILWLSQEHKQMHPESRLFGDIHFSFRPLLHPNSEQVDQFHWDLTFCGYTTTGGRNLRNLFISSPGQTKLRAEIEAEHTAGEVGLFQVFAAKLMDHQRTLGGASMTTVTERIGGLKLLMGIFAYLPVDMTYAANTGKWGEAIYWLREQHELEHPDSHLFDDIEFMVVPDITPYSREVSEWHFWLMYGDLVWIGSPAMRNLYINPKVQAKHRWQVEQDHTPDEVETFQAMAASLLKHQHHVVVLAGITPLTF